MARASWEKRDWTLLVWGAAIVAIIIAMVIGMLLFKSAQCTDIGDRTGRRVAFSYLSGCYVEVNGRMTPTSAWRGEETR